ncbi:MAG: modified peptide precursor CbpA, partial [Dechloromonas sp.]|nr:modified peptide precursor CbpA [Dechloromonas sp.]
DPEARRRIDASKEPRQGLRLTACAKRVVSRSPFCFCIPEEWNMTQTVTSSVKTPKATETQAAQAVPTIAVRKSCNPDGIGLSHYVLMDRKAAK